MLLGKNCCRLCPINSICWYSITCQISCIGQRRQQYLPNNRQFLLAYHNYNALHPSMVTTVLIVRVSFVVVQNTTPFCECVGVQVNGAI